MQVHREIERKFDVDEAFALPDLSGLPEVARVGPPTKLELTATYYDTPDLRLARHRHTLRRRTGGTDAGWHLKTPSVDGERQELRAPLGRPDRVPAALARQVRALVRRQPLAPVAVVTNRRSQQQLLDRAGGVLVEICHDHVQAHILGEQSTAMQWQELEAELGEAGLAQGAAGLELLEQVGAALLAAGARPAASASKLARVLGPAAAARPAGTTSTRKVGERALAGQVVVGYLAEHLEALLAADPRTRRGDPEGVHDLRVAARRLRSALQAFSMLLTPEPAASLIVQLRELGATLGDSRDQQVQLDHLRGRLAQLPPELVLGPVLARIQQELLEGQAGAGTKALKVLDARAYLDLLDQLEAFVADPPLTDLGRSPAAPVLTRLVAKADARLARRVRALRSPPASGSALDQALDRVLDRALDPAQDTAWHAARKAAKRARYAHEASAPVLGKPARKAAKRRQRVQEVLGIRQDAVVARGLLHRLGGRCSGPDENGFTFGLLLAGETLRIEQAEQEFWAAWAEQM